MASSSEKDLIRTVKGLSFNAFGLGSKKGDDKAFSPGSARGTADVPATPGVTEEATAVASPSAVGVVPESPVPVAVSSAVADDPDSDLEAELPRTSVAAVDEPVAVETETHVLETTEPVVEAGVVEGASPREADAAAAAAVGASSPDDGVAGGAASEAVGGLDEEAARSTPPPEGAELVSAPEDEVTRLRREADALEAHAHGALAEASADKIREDAARAAAAAAAAQEELQYAAAEAAEAERRAIVERARPLALRAHETEVKAVTARQEAAETEFHAQVLEKRAAALLAESAELDREGERLLADAADYESSADAARAIHEKLVAKADEHAVGDLPSYVDQCKLEIARLHAKIAELNEEIGWATAEISRVQKDGDDWRRIAARKATEVSRLTLAASTAREEAAAARDRAREAALEARTPAELAESKYAEARELAERASDLEREATQQHEEVLAITAAASAPVEERTLHLKSAAESEVKSKELAAQADQVSERIEQRLFDSQVHADTAARYKAAADAAEADAAFEAGRLEAGAEEPVGLLENAPENDDLALDEEEEEEEEEEHVPGATAAAAAAADDDAGAEEPAQIAEHAAEHVDTPPASPVAAH